MPPRISYQTFGHSSAQRLYLLVHIFQMFVDSVDVINSRLDNIDINVDYQNNMHSKSNRPPTCPKTQVPHLNVTLSTANQRRSDSNPQQETESPWLLKPQHEIPATPPPQVEEGTRDYFTKRVG